MYIVRVFNISWANEEMLYKTEMTNYHMKGFQRKAFVCLEAMNIFFKCGFVTV